MPYTQPGGTGTGDASAAELAKVPKSDSTVTWNATALAALTTQAALALSNILLNKLMALADGTGVYPASVIEDSALAKILSSADPAVTTTYNNTTMSLQALSAAIALKAVASTALTNATWTDARAGYLDKITLIDYTKDIWCAAPTNAAVITTPGTEFVLPNVVVSAQGSTGGLPTGAVVKEAYLLMMCDLLDTSAAANYIETAGDGIYFKISTETHYAHLCAYTSVAGDWYTLASGMSGQIVIGTTNLVNATYGVTTTGVGTYNIMSPETTESLAKAITAHGATMVMKNLRTGIRFIYNMP
jgi:hypothetical protein